MADMGMHKRGLAITLICDYALYGIEPPPQCGKMQMFMDLVYPNLAASRKKALAGQLGAGVTNRKGRRKVENETEIETEIKNEIERECVSRAGFERFWNLYPMKIAKAIRISRKCLGIVYQNIVFAIAVKLLALILVAFGVANMWIAIFADVGVMVIAVLNAIRALNAKGI